MPQNDIYNLNNQQNSGPTFTFNTSPTECSQECQDAYRAAFADIHVFSQDQFGASVDTSDLRVTIVPQKLSRGACGEHQPWGIKISHNQSCIREGYIADDALAHEYFHELQEPHFIDQVSLPGQSPKWFREGSAEYFKYLWLDQTDVTPNVPKVTYEDSRHPIVERLTSRSTRGLRLTSDDITAQYDMGFLAIEYLIAQTSDGENKVATFFTDISWWDISRRNVFAFGRRFQEVFEISLDDFYDDFAAHRACRFPQPGEPCGRIVFSSNRDGNAEIYVMNADGTGVSRLTNHPGHDLDPAWSPDGERIAFRSNRDDEGETGEPAYEIYVMNADGTGVSRLTNADRTVRSPAWSPDGLNIVFSADYGYLHKIYIMSADGTTTYPYKLTSGHEDFDPAWSPDKQRIAFSSRRFSPLGEEAEGIYVINVDGSNLTRLTSYDFHRIAENLSWSPDGQHIAFSENVYISVINADGSNQTRLASGSHPTWSPDGKRIAFGSGRDIYVMNADGSNPTRLTSHPAEDFDPDWTSTVSQIAARVAQLERQVSALQDEASVQQTRIDALKRFLATLQSLVDRLAARVDALESAAPQPQAP